MEVPPEPKPDQGTVGIRELRHNFRQFMDRVRRGERFVITDRGNPIGELVPHTRKLTGYERMLAEGRIIPAKNPGGPWPEPLPPAAPGEPTLSEILQEMRDEERQL